MWRRLVHVDGRGYNVLFPVAVLEEYYGVGKKRALLLLGKPVEKSFVARHDERAHEHGVLSDGTLQIQRVDALLDSLVIGGRRLDEMIIQFRPRRVDVPVRPRLMFAIDVALNTRDCAPVVLHHMQHTLTHSNIAPRPTHHINPANQSQKRKPILPAESNRTPMFDFLPQKV